ncbi:MAG TPA: hypothetical protein VGD97_07475 [Lacunisphaera sp.]
MAAPLPSLTPGQRRILLLSAAINALGALLFVPSLPQIRGIIGLPEADAFYLWLVASWILLFGLAYLAMALSGRKERGVLAVGAGAKATFAFLVLGYVLSGRWPAQASLLAGIDLVLAVIYARWLRQA